MGCGSSDNNQDNKNEPVQKRRREINHSKAKEKREDYSRNGPIIEYAKKPNSKPETKENKEFSKEKLKESKKSSPSSPMKGILLILYGFYEKNRNNV